MQKTESESDSSESETEELFYPRYLLPLKRKHRSNINGSKFVFSYKEKTHVLVHVDTFNTSCGLNRSDSSVVFNKSDGFNSSAGGRFASANVGTTGSTGDFSGGSLPLLSSYIL